MACQWRARSLQFIDPSPSFCRPCVGTFSESACAERANQRDRCPADRPKIARRNCPAIVAERFQPSTVGQCAPRCPTVMPGPVHRYAVPTSQNVELLEHEGHVFRHVGCMNAIRNQGATNPCGRSLAGKAEPHVPVGGSSQSRIERTHLREESRTDNHVGCAGRDRVVAPQ